jgi:hypothetical protein
MPISIAGSGTITGISAGGLPDDCITTADIAAGAITDAKVNASAAIADSKLSGTTCKAWVNFNGTGAVAISASGNVSSITDNGTGDYTVNFTTALVDANFSAVVGIGGDSTSAGNGAWAQRIRSRTTSNIRLWTVRPDNGNLVDSSDANVAFFR